jgi:hexosaminidase
MAFPRLIALAERAWAQSPKWADINEPDVRREEIERDWNQFANRLGQRELPRLDWIYGGVQYRLPPPGAIVRNGLVHANVAFPGLEVRYAEDGADFDGMARVYRGPFPISAGVKLQSIDTRGRGSRVMAVDGQQ